MKHTVEQHIVNCGCRTVGECNHNWFAESRALEACIDAFAQELKEKLVSKMHRGKSGWDDSAWPKEDILKQLREHIDKGDMLDVAAFAMFFWNQQP